MKFERGALRLSRTPERRVGGNLGPANTISFAELVDASSLRSAFICAPTIDNYLRTHLPIKGPRRTVYSYVPVRVSPSGMCFAGADAFSL